MHQATRITDTGVIKIINCAVGPLNPSTNVFVECDVKMMSVINTRLAEVLLLIPKIEGKNVALNSVKASAAKEKKIK